MSDRIVTPIDQAAFDAASAEFLHRHPGGLPAPGTRKYRAKRKEWLKLYQKHGGVVDHGKTFQAPLPGTAVEPCPLKNVIESVELVNGGNPATVLTADAKQHVNLPTDRKFIDGVRVQNIDRLGRTLRARVKFRRGKTEHFKVALLAHNANTTYSAGEQGRRPTFECTRTAAAAEHVTGAFDHYQGAAPIFTGKTKSNGKAIIEGHFEIPVSGGDRYKLVAWDVNGNVVFSQFEIRTTRTLFYATFLADDPNNVRVDQAWFRTQLENTYRTHHIDLFWIGEENLDGIVYHDTLMALTAGDAVRDLARTENCSLGQRYQDYAPYVLKIAFVDHCAEALRKQIQPVRVNGASAGDVVDIPLFTHPPATRVSDPAFDWRKCLWKGLGQTLDDQNRTTSGHEWFQSATLTIHAAGGDMTVACAVGDFTLVPRTGAPDAFVELQLTLPPAVPPGTDVTVNMEVVITNRSVLGQSLTGPHAGITIQPARSMFEAVHANKQLSSAIHELGHAVGMVATKGLQGVKHGYMYDHNGRHCWHAVAGPAASPDLYHALPLKDTGDCVMYGLIPDAGPNMDFCPDCRAVLRKLDLSNGYTG